jgi:3-hydroxyisobutyrate dehydrogenase-like beta-hydroxyacid dehydrogenase
VGPHRQPGGRPRRGRLDRGGQQAAQASGAELTLTEALLPRWRRAAASGHADDDLAAIYATA